VRTRRLAWCAALVLVACVRRAHVPQAGRPAVPAGPEPVTTAAPISPPQGWTRAQRDSALAVLERHRARWAAARPRQYRYRERWDCAWIAPCGLNVVTVAGGRVVSATDTTGRHANAAYLRAAARGPVAGVDAVFAAAAEALRAARHDEVRATYDAARGYPTRVTFDADVNGYDDERVVRVTHFEALP
jgi:hypothetical protein